MTFAFTPTETMAIEEQARQVPYRHKDWFAEGNKTVFEAVKYFVGSGDFYLDVTRMFPLSDPCIGWTRKKL